MIYETLIYGISIITLSVIIDIIIGEVPNKIHPVIYMGKIIDKLNNYLPNTKISGLLIILTTTFIFVTITLIILLLSTINQWIFIILASIILSTTFSINFLIESVRNIQKDLTEEEPGCTRLNTTSKAGFLRAQDQRELDSNPSSDIHSFFP